MKIAAALPGLMLSALMSNEMAGAAPAGADFSAMLMKQGIEAYSEAGARGDEKTTNALTDEDILFAGGDGSVDRDEKRDKDDAVSATLKAQTLSLRQAGGAGGPVASHRIVADDLLRITPDGAVSERDQPIASEDLPVPGVPVQDVVSDWIVHHDDQTAVTTYIGERAVRYGGQTLRFRARVIDTWALLDGQWKLCASHATPLFDDAATVKLADATLDAYTGSYAIGPGAKAVLTRDGATLISSVNGGKPMRYAAEMLDVFYAVGAAPGSARMHVTFRRDAKGEIAGYTSSSGLHLERGEAPAAMPGVGVESHVLPAAHLVVHRYGDMAVATFIHERVTQFYGQTLHTQYRSTETWVKRGDVWKMLALQSRALENEPAAHAIPAADAQAYAGTYAAGASVAGTIAADGGALSLRLGAAPALRLEAIAHDDFVIHGSPGTAFLFQRDMAGHVTGYVARREGRDLQFVKIRA